jgi:phospholipase/carboxylesterase
VIGRPPPSTSRKSRSCALGLLLLAGTIGCRRPAVAARPIEKPASPTLRSITTGANSGAAFPAFLGSDAPVLVLLHGFASRPSEWLPVVKKVESTGAVLFVFPEGPEPTAAPGDRVGGRAWWHLDLSDFVDPAEPGALPDLSDEAPVGLVAARVRVLAFLDELQAHKGIHSGRVILGGFSQGAVVALDVALHDPRPLRGLALLSGTIVNERGWFARLPSRRGMPVFIAHSPEDAVLPYPLAQRLRLALGAAGWLVTWQPFEGGHALSAAAVEGLATFAQAMSAVR